MLVRTAPHLEQHVLVKITPTWNSNPHLEQHVLVRTAPHLAGALWFVGCLTAQEGEAPWWLREQRSYKKAASWARQAA